MPPWHWAGRGSASRRRGGGGEGRCAGLAKLASQLAKLASQVYGGIGWRRLVQFSAMEDALATLFLRACRPGLRDQEPCPVAASSHMPRRKSPTISIEKNLTKYLLSRIKTLHLLDDCLLDPDFRFPQGWQRALGPPGFHLLPLARVAGLDCIPRLLQQLLPGG